MSAASASTIVVGGEPRVELLPPEIAEAQRGRAIRRSMIGIIVAVLIVIGAAYGGATFLASSAQQRLDAENARTADLLAQQQEYIVVRTTQERLATAEAALVVGSSTEINLADFLAEVQSRLPAGAAISTANVDSSTPMDGYAQATVPLQPQRIATFNFAVRTLAINDVRDWLISLEDVPGFADAVPGAVTLQVEDGSYLSAVTLHVNSLALSNRFAPETEEEDGE